MSRPLVIPFAFKKLLEPEVNLIFLLCSYFVVCFFFSRLACFFATYSLLFFHISSRRSIVCSQTSFCSCRECSQERQNEQLLSERIFTTLFLAEFFGAFYKALSFKLNLSKYFLNFLTTTDSNQNSVVSLKKDEKQVIIQKIQNIKICLSFLKTF